MLAIALLLAGCVASSAKTPVSRAHDGTEKLIAAIQIKDQQAFTASLHMLRPLVLKAVEELRRDDGALAEAVRNPFLRLEAEAQREPLVWDSLLREAVLLRQALTRAAAET